MYLPHTLGLTEAPVTHTVPATIGSQTNREVRPGLKHRQTADTGKHRQHPDMVQGALLVQK